MPADRRPAKRVTACSHPDPGAGYGRRQFVISMPLLKVPSGEQPPEGMDRRSKGVPWAHVGESRVEGPGTTRPSVYHGR